MSLRLPCLCTSIVRVCTCDVTYQLPIVGMLFWFPAVESQFTRWTFRYNCFCTPLVMSPVGAPLELNLCRALSSNRHAIIFVQVDCWGAPDTCMLAFASYFWVGSNSFWELFSSNNCTLQCFPTRAALLSSFMLQRIFAWFVAWNVNMVMAFSACVFMDEIKVSWANQKMI